MKRSLAVAMLVVLAACIPAAPPGVPSPAAKTASPAWSATPAPARMQTVTILPGLVPIENPDAPGLIFLVDMRRWTNDLGSKTGASPDETRFLHYNAIPACRLDIASGSDLPAPKSISVKVMRKRVFHVFEFASFAYYESGGVYFKLDDINNLECHTTLETVLAGIVDAGEFYGGATATQVVTRMPVPVDGFICAALTPLLRLGDTAYIGASGVWLRSSPDRRTANGTRLFPGQAPVLVTILDGPVCADGHVYWQVSINEIAANGKTYTGWMAEANTSKYLLLDWNP